MAGDAEDGSKVKGRLELWTELVRVLSWPCLVLLMLAVFWRPLHLVANRMPDLVGQSESISVAGLSLKVGRPLQRKASPAVRKVLGEMTPEDIKTLLSLSGTNSYVDGGIGYGKARYAHLQEIGAAEDATEKMSHLRPTPAGATTEYVVEPTALGSAARDFLIELMNGFVQELRTYGDGSASDGEKPEERAK